jgi:hypothetical protein
MLPLNTDSHQAVPIDLALGGSPTPPGLDATRFDIRILAPTTPEGDLAGSGWSREFCGRRVGDRREWVEHLVLRRIGGGGAS